MIADGLWQDRRHRLPSPHQPRRRRDCLGELVQIDGSEHAWFEDRGPPCTLLAFVDDATSRLMQLRFVTSESAFDYFRTTRAYLEEHGKPVALYSDKHGIFRVNSKDAAGGDGVTQFGRALLALNIDIICANSPQAKGRIERAFGTLQDRMVKSLPRRRGSCGWRGYRRLPRRTHGCLGSSPPTTRASAVIRRIAKDLHRPLAQADDLDEILAWREERTVTRNLTLHYDRMMLILDPTPLTRGLVRKKVEVVNYPDGRFAVQFNGATLGFKLFDKIQTVQPGAIVDNKRLSAVLEQIKAQQAAYPARQQRGHVCAAATAEQPRGAGSAVKGAGATPWCYRSAGRSPPSRPPSRRGEGGFLRDREIYYDARREEMMAWQPPSGGSRPVPIGSRFIAVSLQPAIPRRVAPQQSPLPLHRSPT